MFSAVTEEISRHLQKVNLNSGFHKDNKKLLDFHVKYLPALLDTNIPH
jgi:hypothetical protein